LSRPDAAILVIDDNGDNRYTLCHRLRRQGYTDLEEATNGREALERLAARPFDLVLLDIMMPEMDGYEVLERLNADETWRHIPVIVISALSEFDGVVRCIGLGAEDYLPKPFNSVLLQARVSASLERKRLHDREAAHLAELERKTEELAAAYAQIEQELDAAQSLQRAILPQAFPCCAEFTGHALMRPARQLAGDFYDVLERLEPG
jgi:phosphoserine phosphatase RsbU/P